VVARRFARMTGVALAVLVATGLYQLFSVVPAPVRENMTDYRFGAVFVVKMAVFVLLVILIGAHGMYYGPRIARAAEQVAESDGDEGAVWRLEGLRRTSLIFSLAMLVVALSVLALGVTLGNHDYSYVPFD
jgi:putative copper export protein